MAIVLNVNDLLDALAACEGISESEAAGLTLAMEKAATDIAYALAMDQRVAVSDVSNQPAFGGLCATFVRGVAPDGSPHESDLIARYDEGGDWD